MTQASLLNHRYKILSALAEGGFGKTFLAEDTQMPSKRRCVIKQLKPVVNQPEIARIVQHRFTREAAVLDMVGKEHSQIPTLYAYFVAAGQFYLVQEWIEGESLHASETQRWSESAVRQLLIELLGAIAHIHSINVIHRDIKPSNIIVRKADRLPCLIDFGAVKEVMTTIITASGQPKSSIAIGTAGYMPPEQTAGRPTFASDLYSLGMTAIYLLTGKGPLLLRRDRTTNHLLWQQYAPTVSDSLAQVLSRSVSLYAQNRYTTATDMLAALTGDVASVQPAITMPPASQFTSQPASQFTSQPASQFTSQFASQSAGATILEQQPSASTAKPVSFVQSPIQFPIKPVAIAAGTFLLGAAVLVGVRPQLSAETVESNLSPQETLTAQVGKTTERTSDPQTAEAFTDQAIALYQEGRLQQSLESVEQAISIEPSAEALTLKGDILANQSQRDLPGAIAAYTQALSLSANDPVLLDKRCKVYTDNKDWTLANQDCTVLLGLTPDNAAIYDRRGDIRVALENYQGAIDDYTQAIELNEKAGDASANQPIFYSRSIAYEK
ncbi:MAG: serine/threonine-protein kinase, partial [Cyanobacteria bacterium J06631_9]